MIVHQTSTNTAVAAPESMAQLVQPQVIGGTPADIHKVGGYVYINIDTRRCNGVLVDPEWVLTASYCLYANGAKVAPEKVSVELGCFAKPTGAVCTTNGGLALLNGTTPQKIMAKSIHEHTNMTLSNGVPQPAFGIALIRLASPARTGSGVSALSIARYGDEPDVESAPYLASFGDYVLLPATPTRTSSRTATSTRTQTATFTPSNTATPRSAQTATITRTATRTGTASRTRTMTRTATSTATASVTNVPASQGSTVLRVASIRLLSDAQCTLPGFNGTTLWCADATAEGNDVCYGDTGAPLLSTINGQTVVFGISVPKIQFGAPYNCAPGTQSALIDVTVPVIRNWIDTTIGTTSQRSLNANLGGNAGFGAQVLPRSDNNMSQIDVSAVFPNGIRMGSVTSTLISINANGVVALGDVRSLPANIDLRTWKGAPLIAAFAADGDTSGNGLRPLVGTRSSGANRVWVSVDATLRTVTVTWDDVRPYVSVRPQYVGNTFQAQLRSEENGDVRITFRYGVIQWTYGESNCGIPCAVSKAKHAQIGVVLGNGKDIRLHRASGVESLLRGLAGTSTLFVRDGALFAFDMLPPERATYTPSRTLTPSITPTALSSVPDPASACRWIDANNQVHEYEINPTLLTAAAAHAAAASKSRHGSAGYLVSITSTLEQTCIDAYLSKNASMPNVWANGVRSAGVMRWSGGPHDGTLMSEPDGFTYWGAGEPSNTGGNENYVWLGQNATGEWRWVDAASGYTLPSLIEYTFANPGTPTITPTPTATAVTGIARWDLATLTGSATAAYTYSDTNHSLYCGTSFNALMICPTAVTNSGVSYLRFTGTQYMASTIPQVRHHSFVRIRFRTTAQTGGLFSVVNALVPSTNDRDRDVYVQNGRICSYMWTDNGAEHLCTINTYNDGQWHEVERAYNLNGTQHYIRVDAETVTGFALNSTDWSPAGFVLGVCSPNLPHCSVSGKPAYFVGDIDYVMFSPVASISTPTPTATQTHTRTATALVTFTPSATYTVTRTVTTSSTPTASNGTVVATATATITPTSTPIGQGISNDLLAWYPLNGIRDVGSTLPVQASTIMGPAQYFDGVNDYHQTTVDLANTSYTIAYWAANVLQSPITADNFAISIGNNAYGGINDALIVGMPWGQTDFACVSANYKSVAYTLPISFDQTQWHHYTCVYDKDNKTLKIYVDGISVGTTTDVNALQTNTNFYIGKYFDDRYKGYLRDVMVYNRALNATEINRVKDITPNSVMLSEPHPASACRWVDKGGMVHEYEINQDLLTWDQAKVAAEARTRGGQPGYLVTITSAVENECVLQMIDAQQGWVTKWSDHLGTNYELGPWIGVRRVAVGDRYAWENGPEKGLKLMKNLMYENAPEISSSEWLSHEPSAMGVRYWWSGNRIWVQASDYNTMTIKSIIEYTYPESHAISGVAYTDTNANSQLDSGDLRAGSQPITLTADLAQPIDLVGGGNQFCARLDDGRATCWGRRGDTWRWDQQSAVPIEIDGWRDVRAISNGINTSCALLGNGTVSCLGKNSTGAVGDGTTTDRWTPVAVSGLSNVVALNSGAGYHHCAVLANTTVKCWGENTYYQLGDGTYTRQPTPVTVSGLSGVTQVSVGERHSCARKSDGTVWCWGSNDVGQLADGGIAESATPRQIAGVSGITAVASGPQHVCVLRSDTQVACWGHPTGINGNRSGAVITTPTVIANTTGSISLSVGNEQSCVAKSDGTVWCWGHVFHGEAGWVASGTTTARRSSAEQITSVSNIEQVALSADSGCGRRANGDMLCWGEANRGQLGDSTYQPRGIAREVRVTWQTNPYAARGAALYAGVNYLCAILTDRRVACWGAQGSNNKPAGDPTLLEAGIVPGVDNVVDLHMGQHYACVLRRDATVWCWGYRDGQGGSIMPPDMSSNTPIPQRVTSISDGIALGEGFAGVMCVLRVGQSVQCILADYWNDSFKMRPTSGVSSDIGQVGSGYLHVCAVKHTQGTVWCWGHNNQLQLGNTIGSGTSTSTPQQISGLSTVQQLAPGTYATCVIGDTGQVQCWGYGLEISGTYTNQATPVTIPQATNMKSIRVSNLSCGVKIDGTVWCWGSTLPGETASASMTARRILGVTDVIDVSVNSSTLCALMRGGEIKCMGQSGLLGDGTQAHRGVMRAISEPWQANANQGCEWVDSQGRRHTYESLSGSWTWTQARDMAAARTWRGASGYLATILSPEENRCVHQLYMNSTSREQYPGLTLGSWPRRWLGGSDADSEGTWKWMTGPEQGMPFRENVAGFDYIQSGYSQFQTVSDACKPNCSYNLTWDYLSMLYLQGTHVQRNQWNDELGSDTQGAIVEYTTGAGETARSYTTTTDSQGNYSFAGLAPGIYTVQSTSNGVTSSKRVVIWPDARDASVNIIHNASATSMRYR
jgi:alpha-tubulin suppressor-like RCC1 family protein